MKDNFIARFPVSTCPLIFCVIKGNVEKNFIGEWQGRVNVHFHLGPESAHYSVNPADVWNKKYSGEFDVNKLPGEIVEYANNNLEKGCYNQDSLYRYFTKVAICYFKNISYDYSLKNFEQMKNDIIETVKKSHNSYLLFDLACQLGLV